MRGVCGTVVCQSITHTGCSVTFAPGGHGLMLLCTHTSANTCASAQERTQNAQGWRGWFPDTSTKERVQRPRTKHYKRTGKGASLTRPLFTTREDPLHLAAGLGELVHGFGIHPLYIPRPTTTATTCRQQEHTVLGSRPASTWPPLPQQHHFTIHTTVATMPTTPYRVDFTRHRGAM